IGVAPATRCACRAVVWSAALAKVTTSRSAAASLAVGTRTGVDGAAGTGRDGSVTAVWTTGWPVGSGAASAAAEGATRLNATANQPSSAVRGIRGRLCAAPPCTDKIGGWGDGEQVHHNSRGANASASLSGMLDGSA